MQTDKRQQIRTLQENVRNLNLRRLELESAVRETELQMAGANAQVILLQQQVGEEMPQDKAGKIIEVPKSEDKK